MLAVNRTNISRVLNYIGIFLFNLVKKTTTLGFLFVTTLILTMLPLVMPFKLLPMVIAGYIFIIFSILAVVHPILMIYFVILSSSTSALIRNLGSVGIAGVGMSASGLRWAFVALVTAVVNLFYFRKYGIPKSYRIYGTFLIYAAIRCLIYDDLARAADEYLWYILPFLVGLFTYYVVRESDIKHLISIDWCIRYSVFIILLIFAYYFGTGGLEWTKSGPKGDVVSRTLSLYTTVTLTLSLARWRYHPDHHQQTNGLILGSVAFFSVTLTLSRMATAIAFLVAFVSRTQPAKIFRIAITMIMFFIVLASLFLMVPALRERTFQGGEIPKSLPEFARTFNSSGRFDVFWPATINSAMKSPIIGHGPGTSSLEVAKHIEKRDLEEYNTHNEYLALWHDYGAIGVSLVIAFWISILLRLWKKWRKYHESEDRPELAYWSMASVLAAAVCAGTAITANTFHYPFVTAMSFMIISCFMALEEKSREEKEELSADKNIKLLPAAEEENT